MFDRVVADKSILVRGWSLFSIVAACMLMLSACSDDPSERTAEPESTIAPVVAAQDEMTDGDEGISVDMEMSVGDTESGEMAMDMGESDAAEDADRDPFVRRAVNRQAAGFSLTDQNGESVKLSDYRGKWIVVDWIYTSCMTVCPALTGEMVRVRDGLGDKFGEQVQFLSLTFDPTRDDSEAMRKYAQNVGADSDSWAWLTGTKQETDAAALAFGVSYTPAEAMMGVAMFDHTALTVIIDPAGNERFHYYGIGWSEDMTATLDILVPENTVFDRTDSGEATLVSLNEPAKELLAPATSYYWKAFELEDGITAQSAHNFSGPIPTKRYFYSRMDSLEENGWTNLGKEDEGGEVFGLYYMFQKSASEFIGVGSGENVSIEVSGDDFRATLDSLFWLGGALCCPA